MTPPREHVGALDPLYFNWPTFALAAVVAGGGLLVVLVAGLGAAIGVLALTIALPTTFWLVASLAALWWVYERSGITRWSWLQDLLPARFERWLNITTGFDHSTAALVKSLPRTIWTSVDVFDAAASHDGPVRRARSRWPPLLQSLATSRLPIPLPNESVDAVFLLLAGHEVRSREDRDAMFREVARLLRADGRAIMVEHTRDLANAIAFGPWLFHFFTRAEWCALATSAGLATVQERRVTPFVWAFVFERP